MSAQRCDRSHRLNVLFIGNSFTYVQNMPHMVHVIADSLPGPCVDVAMIAIGGATLRDHWLADSAIVRIRQGGWTHVVLNDQSSFGEVFFLNGNALDSRQARAVQLLAQSTTDRAFTPTEPAPITAELSEPKPTTTPLSRGSVLGRWRGAAMVLPTPSGDSVRFDLMIGLDSLRLSAGLAFAGTATTAVKNGVVTVSGKVAAPSRRGGGTTEFTVELRGAVVGNVMSGVMSVRQPNGPDAARFGALGTFKAQRVPD